MISRRFRLRCNPSRALAPAFTCLLSLAGTVHAQQPAADAPAAAQAEPQPSESPAPNGDVSVDLCIDTHTHSQELRITGKLLESRKELLVCSARSCPSQIRRDCAGWLEQLREQIPSVSFRATIDGRSRADVEVFLDGELVASRLSGRAIEINPGVYSARFVAPGLPALERELVVNEGEQFRIVSAEFQTPAGSATAPSPGPTPPAGPAVDAGSGTPVSALVFAGVGAAAAISGAAWGYASYSRKKFLEKDCAPGCTDNEIDVVRQRALIADVSFGLSAASFVTAAAIYLLSGDDEAPAPGVDVGFLPEGGVLGRFTFTTP